MSNIKVTKPITMPRNLLKGEAIFASELSNNKMISNFSSFMKLLEKNDNPLHIVEISLDLPIKISSKPRCCILFSDKSGLERAKTLLHSANFSFEAIESSFVFHNGSLSGVIYAG